MLMPQHLHSSVIPHGNPSNNVSITMTDTNRKIMLSISNTRSAYCSRVIEKKLNRIPGIANVSVSYLTDKVLVRYDPSRTNIDVIRESIKKLGYDTIEHR